MARYKVEHKEHTRERIVEAAERGFKKNGFSGIGVDGLAKEAGVTSGAFYGHFESKQAVFSAALTSGMEAFISAIQQLKNEMPDQWWEAFVRIYLGQKRICDLAEGCALQTLAPEIGRSDIETKALFERELLKLANQIAENKGEASLDATWANLAALVGGVTLARAVADKKLSEQIAMAVSKVVLN